MEESAVPPLLGLIGLEIAGNPTQFAIERVLKAADLDWQFLSFNVAANRLNDAVRGLEALGFRGLAIAPSCSVAIYPLLDCHAPSSQLSQWVDVVSRDGNGRLMGHNLIAQSLVEWLAISVPDTVAAEPISSQAASASISPSEVAQQTQSSEASEPAIPGTAEPTTPSDQDVRTAVVLGNTGKSVAMAKLLLASGFTKVYFRDLTPTSEQTGFVKTSLRADVLGEASLLIRAGVSEDSSEVAELSEGQLERLSTECAVVDLGTKAGTSPALRFASSRGLRVLSSIDLMVLRTTKAFQLWTGTDPDTNLLREAFEEYLEI